MILDNNQDVSEDVDIGGEGAEGSEDKISLSKEEYDNLKATEATLGSLKRELKDLKKAKEEVKEEPKETPKNQTEEFGLLQKTYLRAAGITDEDEVELAKETQKKTGVEWDKLPDDDYFQLKLQKLRDQKANEKAGDIPRGRANAVDSKDTINYWGQKGELPTAKDIPDRKKRAEIIRALRDKEVNQGGMFYND